MLGMVANIVSMLVSLGSIQSLFSSANQLQLLMMLPLFRIYMPKAVIGFYFKIGWAMFGLDFLKFDIWPGYNTVSSTFSTTQSDQYLYLIGIEDSSSLMNSLSMFILLVWLFLLHPLMYCMYWWVEDKATPNRCHRVIIKAYKLFTFNVYVRTLIQVYLIVIISTTSEVTSPDLSNWYMAFSFGVSIFLLVLCYGTILLNIVEWWKLRKNIRIEDDSYFGEFFSGLKDDNRSRSFNVANLIRRSVLATWLILFAEVNFLVLIAVFWFFQLVFVIYTFWLRPYIQKRDNLKEWVNEFSFLVFAGIHCYFNSETTWNETIGRVSFIVSYSVDLHFCSNGKLIHCFSNHHK